MMRVCLLLLITTLLLLASCNNAGTEVPYLVELPHADVPHYGFFDVPRAGTEIIREDSTWLRYWRDYWGSTDSTGKTSPPSIDFNQNMVVAVFYGRGYFGCHNYQNVIQGIWKSSESLTVKIGPLPSLGYCDAGIMPLQMVTIPKSNLQVLFVGDVPE